MVHLPFVFVSVSIMSTSIISTLNRFVIFKIPYRLVNIHCIFVTFTVSVIVPFQINIKALFRTFACFSKKK